MAQVVIAVRGGPGAKSRLAELLGPEERAVLTELMLRDMLDAVGRAPRVSGIWVVTPTAALAETARGLGVKVIDQAEPGGLNAAFRQAQAEVADAAPYDAVALLPGDLPMLEPGDLDAALALAEAHEVVLAPAADGGTGALVIRAGVDFAPTFGDDSFAVHQDQVHRRDLSVAVVDAMSLSRDLDRPQDVAFLLQTAPHGRTAAFLSERSARLTPP
jgi:2-phospho-L-lactate guanylyltransferase